MKNKIVLITGASGGIGRALAVKFAAEGANLALAARNLDALTALKTELEAKYNVKVAAIACDVSERKDCNRFVAEAMNTFGRIDVLINNAGISMRAALKDLDLAVLEKLMQTNFWGTVYCTKAALPYLIKSQGSIVGVSSIAGFKGLPERTGYSASKFAMNGFLDALRVELIPQNVHVLVACPGYTASNIRENALLADGKAQQDSPRDEAKMMTADEAAAHIYRAVVRRRRDLVLTPVGKITQWLNFFFPAWLDKLTFKEIQKEKPLTSK